MAEIVLSNGWKVRVDEGVYRILGDYRWSALAGHNWGDGRFSDDIGYYMGVRSRLVEWVGVKMVWSLHRQIAGVPMCFRVRPRDGDWHDMRFGNIWIGDWGDREYRYNVFSGSSVYSGVKWDRYYGLWRSEISGLVIGYYWNEIDAARAYNVKLRQIYGKGEENDLVVMKEWLKHNTGGRKRAGLEFQIR